MQEAPTHLHIHLTSTAALGQMHCYLTARLFERTCDSISLNKPAPLLLSQPYTVVHLASWLGLEAAPRLQSISLSRFYPHAPHSFTLHAVWLTGGSCMAAAHSHAPHTAPLPEAHLLEGPPEDRQGNSRTPMPQHYVCASTPVVEAGVTWAPVAHHPDVIPTAYY